MKKTKQLCLLLAIILSIGAFTGRFTASAEFVQWESPRALPADVAEEYSVPNPASPFYTEYAPWLRNMHLMNAYEKNLDNYYGGEGLQLTRQLAISPVDSNIIYFITDTSGIYKTTDGGKHWYNTTNNSAGYFGKGLCCDNQDKNIVYAYMNEVGVHRSKNGGKTWEQILPDSVSNIGFFSNTIVQDDAGNTYMAVSSGIYRLNKEDDNLTQLYSGKNMNICDLDVSADGKTIYAVCKKLSENDTYNTPGVYVSTNGGETWEVRSGSSDGKQNYNVESLAMYPGTTQTIYAGMSITKNGTEGEFGMYKSTDGGVSYTKCFKSGSIKFLGLCFGTTEIDNKGYPLYFSYNQEHSPLRVYYPGKYKDSDWWFGIIDHDHEELLPDDTTIDTIHRDYAGYYYEAFAPDLKNPGRVIFAASGIYEKTAEGAVNPISGGFSGAAVTDIAFDSKGKMFMTLMDVGFCRQDGTEVYDPKQDTYPSFTKAENEADKKEKFADVVFDPNNDERIIAFIGRANGSADEYGIRISENGGESFNALREDAKLAPSDAVCGNTKLLCYGNDKKTIYSTYHNSYDNGETWEPNEKYLLAVSQSDNALQLSMTGTLSSANLYYSSDGGESHSQLFSSFDLGDLRTVSFDVADNNIIWILTGSKLYKIDIKNKKANNLTSNINLGYNAFSYLAQNPKKSDHLLLASRPGIEVSNYRSDFKLAESIDGGKTWYAVPGFFGKEFHRIIFNDFDEAFICTMGGIMIYDYTKFNYYADCFLNYNGDSRHITLKRVDESGNNINNGEYIIAPQFPFTVAYNTIFKYWIYNEQEYPAGDKIKITE